MATMKKEPAENKGPKGSRRGIRQYDRVQPFEKRLDPKGSGYKNYEQEEMRKRDKKDKTAYKGVPPVPGQSGKSSATVSNIDGQDRLTERLDYTTTKNRKNLLGRNVKITKTARFGNVEKGTLDKAKSIGDKTITRTRQVSSGKGIPVLTKGSVPKVKTVTRVATSKNKAMKAAGDIRGIESGKKLGMTFTKMDTKSKLFAPHKKTFKSKNYGIGSKSRY